MESIKVGSIETGELSITKREKVRFNETVSRRKGVIITIKKVGSGREGGGRKREFEVEAR
jgi:hypothetical protein